MIQEDMFLNALKNRDKWWSSLINFLILYLKTPKIDPKKIKNLQRMSDAHRMGEKLRNLGINIDFVAENKNRDIILMSMDNFYYALNDYLPKKNPDEFKRSIEINKWYSARELCELMQFNTNYARNLSSWLKINRGFLETYSICSVEISEDSRRHINSFRFTKVNIERNIENPINVSTYLDKKNNILKSIEEIGIDEEKMNKIKEIILNMGI